MSDSFMSSQDSSSNSFRKIENQVLDNQKEGENKHHTELNVKKSGSDNEALTTPKTKISTPLSRIFGNFRQSLMSVLGKKDG